ncbi:hypothetical protein ACWEOG_27395 [Amycolatopsis japonica]
MALKTPKTVGSVDGHRVQFIPTHRQDNDTNVVTSLVMAIPVSIEDVTAALMFLTWGASAADVVAELGRPDDAVRGTVMETMFCIGGDELSSQRMRLDEIEPGSWDATRLEMVRARVSELFGPAAVLADSVPSPRAAGER